MVYPLPEDPVLEIPDRWTHDDNMAVQAQGWGIFNVYGNKYDLFFVGAGYRYDDNASLLLKNLIAKAPYDPLAAKAVSILAKQRFLHPKHDFNFLKDTK